VTIVHSVLPDGESVKIISSDDRKHRINILRRGDGFFMFGQETHFEDSDRSDLSSLGQSQLSIDRASQSLNSFALLKNTIHSNPMKINL
jgi:hypothetical protein